MEAVDWKIANLFHPDGAVIYRAAIVKVPLTGERPHLKLQFDEYDNFRAESLNVRVTGGPLKLASFRVPGKNRFDDVVRRLSDDKPDKEKDKAQQPGKGKVLSVEPLNNGLLMVRLKMRNGEEKQFVDVVEITKTPRRKAMVHLEFEHNTKLTTGGEARVPLQINYVLTEVTSIVTYQMNLENMKLDGFVRIRNQSNKHFQGLAGYNTTPIGPKPQRREFAMYTRSAPSTTPPSVAAEYGLDKATIFLGEHFVTDRANILFVSDAVENVSLFFEVRLGLPSETRDARAKPVLEFPNNSVPIRLADGSIILYDRQGYKITSGMVSVGGTHVRADLQPLDHSVTVSNKPDFEQLEGSVVEVSNVLSMNHTGTATAKLHLKFPEFMRWGSNNYNATFESNLSYLVKLQSGVNSEVVKIKYQKQMEK